MSSEDMTPVERQRLDRNLDRIERMLEMCIDEDKKFRKQRRAEWRAKMEKLKRLHEERAESESDNQEPGT